MSHADRLRWNEIYRQPPAAPQAPSDWLLDVAAELGPPGRALDLAGGTGRNGAWLAGLGWRVTVADVSDVALAHAADHGLGTLLLDLESEPFPAGPWDAILCFDYLQRGLFSEFPRALAPGGFLIFAQPTLRNLERNPKPSARFLLEEKELPRLVQGLRLLRHAEEWTAAGRHEARALARKPFPGER